MTTTGRHRPKKKLGVDTSRRQEIWGGRLSLDGKHAAKRKFEDSPSLRVCHEGKFASLPEASMRGLLFAVALALVEDCSPHSASISSTSSSSGSAPTPQLGR